LFVVAESADGHSILYKRTRDPKFENVVVYDHQSDIKGVATGFNMGVVEFFVSICSGKINVPGLSEVLIHPLEFRPLKTTWET
jgi:hypothetical protein